jgi:lipoate-protein ligase A
LVPGEFTWVDVTIPRDDPLHVDDVGHAFRWLGEAWAGALRSLGLDVSLHPGAPVTNQWSSHICFAGIGSGEVLLAGRKLVGLSQRRTRAATRFQSVVLHHWDPHALVSLLAIEHAAAASTFVHDAVTAVDLDHETLVAALLRVLP